MTMLQLFIGFSFFQWNDFSHYFHFRRLLFGPLIAKVTDKLVISTYLDIKLCILLILHRVNHAFYVMVTNI
jgi:hypothetical protein